MAMTKHTELVLDRRFDPKTCRHSINGQVQVLHCHHYATLYTQLANDCGMLDGKRLLAEVSEDTFYNILRDYYAANNISNIEDRISIAEQYFAISGLGKMTVRCASPESGEVELSTSHVDQGWIKKWGHKDQPVNFIGWGYISAMFSAVFDKPTRAYSVTETQSIVSGAETSRFEVVAI